MSTAINWYIWQGKIFRVPTATIQKRKLQGGWGLVDIGVKCKSLLINRLWKQGCKEDSATAAWLKYWNLAGSQGNPPNRLGKLQNMKYLLIYAYNIAYISPQGQNEKANAFKNASTTPCTRRNEPDSSTSNHESSDSNLRQTGTVYGKTYTQPQFLSR